MITWKEAISDIDYIRHLADIDNCKCKENITLDMAINAMKKEIPKELMPSKLTEELSLLNYKIYDVSLPQCPNCHTALTTYTEYCPYCGQKLKTPNTQKER
jgi:rRNA maturation endonuclease Nob1